MNDEDLKRVERALLSVSDKRGVVELARALVEMDVQLLSTGGTFRVLAQAGVPVTEVAEHTGFPEIMDGRVKTLHPRIHGGILGRRDVDQQVMAENGIVPIDLVVVNLYPFEETVSHDDCTDALAVDNIDIGGPAMVRSAAKNHDDVLVMVDPEDYQSVVDALRTRGGSDLQMRRRFAVKAFRHTASYDCAIAAYFGSGDAFPQSLTMNFRLLETMRYGENPHQQAAFYREPVVRSGTVAHVQQLQGKALSYNNVADTDAALECVKVFDAPACVIVKHGNPCGVAEADSVEDAYRRAYATDPTSAFGGIIAFNRPLDDGALGLILERQFVEVIVAPVVTSSAVELARSKKNVRLLAAGELADAARGMDFKRVAGGLLVQTADDECLAPEGVRVVSRRAPSVREMADLLFAWKVAWFVKSNAIVFARDRGTVGVGAGQMSRVVSARIAAMKAEEEGLEARGAVMASDAFFPFRDGIDAAAEVGIAAVIQPGGSVRDEETVAAADEHDMAMVFTGVRHFRH